MDRASRGTRDLQLRNLRDTRRHLRHVSPAKQQSEKKKNERALSFSSFDFPARSDDSSTSSRRNDRFDSFTSSRFILLGSESRLGQLAETDGHNRDLDRLSSCDRTSLATKSGRPHIGMDLYPSLPHHARFHNAGGRQRLSGERCTRSNPSLKSMQRANGTLIALGASHHTAPIEIREKFSISENHLGNVYQPLANVQGVKEVALLSTCNRTELYAVANGETSVRLLEETFCEFQKLTQDAFTRYGFERRGPEAVRHLFAVASGLDSLVVGETEILGQVTDAYTPAGEQQTVGPLLTRLFQRAFQAAKWVRTNTSIGRGQVSVGSVAVDLAIKIFGNLKTRKILLIGAGEISERTLTALKSRGATALTICNRTDHRAMDLATEHGGNALPFDQLAKSIGDYDIAICSTSSPDPVLTKN